VILDIDICLNSCGSAGKVQPLRLELKITGCGVVKSVTCYCLDVDI
jgi:hypothetical protein